MLADRGACARARRCSRGAGTVERGIHPVHDRPSRRCPRRRRRHEPRRDGRPPSPGQSAATGCPNLPQRRPAARSAANETAEYQRFFSRAPARSGSLWQIWTNGVRGPVGEGVRGSGGGRCGRPDDRGDHFDDTAGPAGALVREGPRHPARSWPPEPVPGASPIPGPRRPVPDFSRARRFPVERADGRCAFDWKPTRSRKNDGPRAGEPAAERALPADLAPTTPR